MFAVDMSAGHAICRRSVGNRFSWPAQAMLAIVFGLAGAQKLVMSLASLAAPMPWVSDVPAVFVRGIGLAEMVAAAGLLVPGALRRFPHVPRLAALGLAVLMACAAAFHLSRGEAVMLSTNLGLGLLAVFVAWKRR
jgi:hypothetical protein